VDQIEVRDGVEVTLHRLEAYRTKFAVETSIRVPGQRLAGDGFVLYTVFAEDDQGQRYEVRPGGGGNADRDDHVYSARWIHVLGPQLDPAASTLHVQIPELRETLSFDSETGAAFPQSRPFDRPGGERVFEPGATISRPWSFMISLPPGPERAKGRA
jgi:hypothetical protein